MKQNVYLASKPRYEILDGLRGVAAMLVVAFHLFETYSKGAPYQIINHGYLAVDFFFVLSGFVIGYAYDDRWDKMTTWGFFKRRLVRLQPMLVIGAVIGLLFYLFGDQPMFRLIAETPGWKLALVFVLGCFMIPVRPSMDVRGWDESFPINGPQWTLFFEYIANILYALVFRHLPKWGLAICVAVFAVLTLDFTLGWDILGIAPNYQGRVIGGWSLTVEQMYVGFARLLYPFFCGLLISRMGKSINLKGAFWWCALILAVILCMPRIGAAPTFDFATKTFDQGGVLFNGIYAAVCILLIFPVLVMIGAGSTINGAKSVKVCKFFGEISYPLYITHYPLIYMQMAWTASHPEAPQWQRIMMSVSVFFIAIFIAWAVLKLFDEPVRKWLTEHWLKRK